MVSVNQMRDYLRVALSMESDLYAAQTLVSKLETKVDEYGSVKYYTTVNSVLDSITEELKENKKVNKVNKIIKVVLIWSIVSVFLLGIIFAFSYGIDLKNVFSDKESILGLLMVVGTFAYCIAVWVIIAAIIKKVARNKANKKIAKSKMINQINAKKSDALSVRNKAILANYKVQLDNAKTVLSNAQNNLRILYSENILPQKYRNLPAIATMYQWLKDGRCTEIYGHGGVFDTYENEIKANIIIGELRQIKQKLDAVMENQEMLYREVVRGNQIAENTYNSITRIERNSEQIVSDVSRIKVNSEISAMNSMYQTRMQEYSYYKSFYR